MPYDPTQNVIRRPRHSATDDAADCRVWLSVPGQDQNAEYDVELMDFSRQGARVESESPIASGEMIVLHVEPEGSKQTESRCPAKVSLAEKLPARDAGRSAFSSRTKFPYEIIGELFSFAASLRPDSVHPAASTDFANGEPTVPYRARPQTGNCTE